MIERRFPYRDEVIESKTLQILFVVITMISHQPIFAIEKSKVKVNGGADEVQTFIPATPEFQSSI